MTGQQWMPPRTAELRRSRAAGVVLMLAGSSWLVVVWMVRLIT